MVGTLIAALVTNALPTGAWTAALVPALLLRRAVVFLAVAALVAAIGAVGALSLTDSRATEEPAPAEEHSVAA